MLIDSDRKSAVELVAMVVLVERVHTLARGCFTSSVLCFPVNVTIKGTRLFAQGQSMHSLHCFGVCLSLLGREVRSSRSEDYL